MATTKKDLESKIAELEAKLEKLSSQLEAKPTTQTPPPKPQTQTPPPPPKPTTQAPPPKPTTQAPPPKPQPAATSPRGSLPKGSAPPKPQTQQSTAASTVATALETVYNNFPMTDTHSYKAKTPGYTPAPNRYFARRTAPRGTCPTQNWNLQKAKVSGYTQPSNLYFATRARLAYHPPTKTFTGYGLSLEGVTVQAQAQQAPPKKSSSRGSLPKGF